MVFLEKDLDKFLEVSKGHNIKPLLKEVMATINDEDVKLYETIGLDSLTEFILKKEMEVK